MNDWKTTVAGVIGAIGTALTSCYANGGQPTTEAVAIAVAMAVIGFLAKDAKK